MATSIRTKTEAGGKYLNLLSIIVDDPGHNCPFLISFRTEKPLVQLLLLLQLGCQSLLDMVEKDCLVKFLFKKKKKKKKKKIQSWSFGPFGETKRQLPASRHPLSMSHWVSAAASAGPERGAHTWWGKPRRFSPRFPLSSQMSATTWRARIRGAISFHLENRTVKRECACTWFSVWVMNEGTTDIKNLGRHYHSNWLKRLRHRPSIWRVVKQQFWRESPIQRVQVWVCLKICREEERKEIKMK